MSQYLKTIPGLIKNKNKLSHKNMLFPYLYNTQAIINGTGKTRLRFPQKLFLSYILLMVLCVGVMGIFSYSLITRNIVDRTIDSNKEILNQLKNTVDTFILGSIDKLSLTLLEDLSHNPYVSYYMIYPLDGHIVDTTKVYNYLNTLKVVNPIIHQIAIFYAPNDLLVSTQYIRFPGERYMMSMDELNHVKQLTASGNNQYWIYESEFNYMNEYARQLKINSKMLADTQPENLITFVRKISNTESNTDLKSSILISVSEKLFHEVIKSSISTDIGSIFIVNEQGLIISHSNKEFLNTSINKLSYGNQIINSAENLGYFTANVDGVHCVISYTSSEYNNWKYVTVKPTASIAQSARFLWQIISIIAILTLLVGLVVSMLSSKKFYLPLKRLVDSCTKAGNKVTYLHEYSRDEYAFIGSTLDILSDKIYEQESKIKESYPILKHHFIMSLINGTYTDINELSDKMNLLKLELPYENYIVITLKLCKSNFINFANDLRANDLRTYELTKLEIIDNVENMFTGSDTKCICTQSDYNIITVINFMNTYNTYPDIVKVVNKALQSSKGKLVNNLGIKLYVGIGSMVYGMDSVNKSYNEAECCIKYSYIFPDKFIYSIDEVCEWNKINNVSLESVVNEFNNSLKSQNNENTIKIINKLVNTIKKEHCSYLCTMKILSKVFIHIEHFLETMVIDVKDVALEDLHFQFNKHNNINEVEKWLIYIMSDIYNYIDSRRSQSNIKIVERAKHYISQNINNQDMSLNMVAEALYISPGYLSRLIKEETGYSFIEYVTDYKLEMAKNVLLSSNMKVEEIAIMNGYSSSQYFIRRFKRKYGFTPREYKIMHGKHL